MGALARPRFVVALAGLVTAWTLGSGGAQPGTIILASTSDAGIKGNSPSRAAGLSSEGTKVAFHSTATNLDPLDTDTIADVYVKDLVTGEITLASTSDSGVKGDHSSSGADLSADGTTVLFSSRATTLDPADTDTIADVYVKDLVTGEITLASTSDWGVKGNNRSYADSLSADGSIVLFSSKATNLDPADINVAQDPYVKNLVTGNLTLASTSDAGVKANDSSYPDAISANGTRVAFHSLATNLDPADIDVLRDVYVKNLVTGNLTLASTSDAGVKGNRPSGDPDLSGSGRKVTFISEAYNLDPADSDRVPDVYVKDLTTGDITLASTSDSGIKGNDGSLFPTLSADGTKVAFYSFATNLDPADTDSTADVYVKDLTSGDTILASTSDSGVKGNDRSDESHLSANGTRVVFSSKATNLEPADADSILDVYVKEFGPATQVCKIATRQPPQTRCAAATYGTIRSPIHHPRFRYRGGVVPPRRAQKA